MRGTLALAIPSQWVGGDRATVTCAHACMLQTSGRGRRLENFCGRHAHTAPQARGLHTHLSPRRLRVRALSPAGGGTPRMVRVLLATAANGSSTFSNDAGARIETAFGVAPPTRLSNESLSRLPASLSRACFSPAGADGGGVPSPTLPPPSSFCAWHTPTSSKSPQQSPTARQSRSQQHDEVHSPHTPAQLPGSSRSVACRVSACHAGFDATRSDRATPSSSRRRRRSPRSTAG